MTQAHLWRDAPAEIGPTRPDGHLALGVEARGVIGTAAAIALGIGAAASAGAQVHGTKSAGKTNKRAIEAGERSDVRAERLEDARIAEDRRAREADLAETKAAREAALQRDKERWADYLRVNEPFWKAGSGVLSSLYDIAGMGGSAPSYVSPTQPPPGAPPPSAPPPISGTMPIPGNNRGQIGHITNGGTQPLELSRVQPMSIADLMQLAQLGSTTPTLPSGRVAPYEALMQGR